MKTIFTAHYYRRTADFKGLSLATIQSPVQDLDNVFSPGDYVCFHKGGLSLKVEHTHHLLPSDTRHVNIETNIPTILLIFEREGWTFTEGRDCAFNDHEEMMKSAPRR